jgi:GTP-binding protein HflX
LEEVSEADMLIHVVDLSHPRVDEQMQAVDSVVNELGAFGKQTLIVFNKVDLLENPDLAKAFRQRFPGSVAISAKTGQGIEQLIEALQSALGAWRLRSRFRVPLSESNLIAEVHRVGHVLDLSYEGDDAIILAHVPPHLEQKLSSFALTNPDGEHEG